MIEQRPWWREVNNNTFLGLVRMKLIIFYFKTIIIHKKSIKLFFLTIFKYKGKYVNLHFYKIKKIQFQSHSSHHSQTFINFT